MFRLLRLPRRTLVLLMLLTGLGVPLVLSACDCSDGYSQPE